MSKKAIVKLIDETYNILKQQKDYSPKNMTVNLALGRFVETLLEKNKSSKSYCNKVMSDEKVAPFIDSLRNMCQKAECEMESFWAKYFENTPDLSFSCLKDFWYYKQYKQIIKNESSMIETHSLNIKNVAFIGSGPLPMSAIILNNRKNINIDLIDRDNLAIERSKKICEKLCSSCHLFCESAINIDYKKYDLVFVASMVEDKIALFNKLYNDDVKYIIVRDAEKFSEIFYHKLEPKLFEKYAIKDFIKGDDLTVNSSYLLKRKTF